MGVTVVRNFPPLAELPLTNQALMREVGLLAREQIVRRTREGRDMRDVPFAPYSQGYSKQKAEAVGSAAPVNLTLSGAMLNALQIIAVTENSVTLGFIG